MKFSEMKYEKPDFEKLAERAEKIRAEIENAATFDDADRAFMEYDSYSKHIATLYSLAYIRHTIDTNDKFYDEQQEFWDSHLPQLQAYDNKIGKALLDSKFRPQLEEKYGKIYFLNTEIERKGFAPEIIPDLQEENKLTTEYGKLIASAQIDFDGGKKTISEMSLYKQSNDDKIRNAAWEAEGNFYRDHSAELDEIYDKLVKVRTAQAKKLGYENYIPLGYAKMIRNCYDMNDVDKFRKAVIKYVVPVADRLYREQAERTGLPYPMTFSDAALKFRSGNPMPCVDSDGILAHGKKFYHELSPETAEFIDVMFDNELLDVLSKKGKAGGGYCDSIADYNVPFIFANFNGTSDDVEVMTHEAGHAFAFYMARNVVPYSCSSPTYEACECHSMSMEFFAWKWAEGFFGKETEKFRYSHLFDAIKFIPYGTMVDHFQHLMYEKPELTPAQRHEEWKKLTAVYMPWMKLDGSVFYGEGMGWQRQMHIYERPFYYIDYCLAQTISLEFWALSQQDYKSAWEKYMKFVKQAGTKTFTEIIDIAGLDTPFGEKALETVAKTAADWLDKADISMFK